MGNVATRQLRAPASDSDAGRIAVKAICMGSGGSWQTTEPVSGIRAILQ